MENTLAVGKRVLVKKNGVNKNCVTFLTVRESASVQFSHDASVFLNFYLSKFKSI